MNDLKNRISALKFHQVEPYSDFWERTHTNGDKITTSGFTAKFHNQIIDEVLSVIKEPKSNAILNEFGRETRNAVREEREDRRREQQHTYFKYGGIRKPL
jgi:hypothetical protein